MLKPVVSVDFEVPKYGEPPEDCQDSVYAVPRHGRFAIADGATVSFFPRQWARRLTKHFCAGEVERVLPLLKDGTGWNLWLQPAISGWRKDVEDVIAHTSAPESVLLRNRLDDDDYAGATFVGLAIDPATSSWRAVAVGDSCLFHVRKQRLLTSFPFESSTEFNSTPECLLTRGENIVTTQLAAGGAQAGDVFLLATDALAKWLHLQREASEDAWEMTIKRLLEIRAWGEFFELVQRTRQEQGALDDDVGLLIVTLEPGEISAPFKSGRWKVGSSRRSAEIFAGLPIDPTSELTGAAPVRSASRSSGRWWTMLHDYRGTLVALSLVLFGIGLGGHAQAKFRSVEARLSGLEKLVIGGMASVPSPDLGPLAGGTRTEVLPAGVMILTEPRTGADPLLVLQNPASVTRNVSANSDWFDVEIHFWLAEKTLTGNILAVTTGDSVTVVRGVNARATPEAESATVLGRTVTHGRFALLAQQPDPSYGHWLQVRATGYVRVPR